MGEEHRNLDGANPCIEVPRAPRDEVAELLRSSIAINGLKAGAPLPLGHIGVAQSSSNSRSAT